MFEGHVVPSFANRPGPVAVIAAFLCAHSVTGNADEPYVIGLGDLPGGFEFGALGMSADGTTVVG